jgi:hypothetical protein
MVGNRDPARPVQPLIRRELLSEMSHIMTSSAHFDVVVAIGKDSSSGLPRYSTDYT